MKRHLVKLFSIIAVFAVIIGLMVGCGKPTSQDQSQQSQANKPTKIVIKGSDTEVNLVQAMAEAFKKTYSKPVDISVSGGGSGTGIAALINGQIDIANASRPMKDKEKNQAKQNGIEVGTFIFARDGVTVIVHPNNSVSKLTLDQLGKIYRGEITNWKEVGGKDMPITLYGRQNTSGTYAFFRSAAVKGDYAQTMRAMNGNADIVNAVAQDESGIGYVGVGYYKQAKDKVKEVALSKDGKEFYSSTDIEAINKKKYPLVRPLYQFVKLPMTEAVKAFLNFERSSEGQALVEQYGFYPIGPEEEAVNEKLLGK